MKITKNQLFNIRCGASGEVMEDKIIDHTRWSVIHEIVVKLDDKYYACTYSVGATECQWEQPEDEYELTEVRPVEKIITVYI